MLFGWFLLFPTLLLLSEPGFGGCNYWHAKLCRLAQDVSASALGQQRVVEGFGRAFAVPLDAAGFEHVGAEGANPGDHIAEIVTTRVDRPYDVAHGANGFPRGLAMVESMRCESVSEQATRL